MLSNNTIGLSDYRGDIYNDTIRLILSNVLVDVVTKDTFFDITWRQDIGTRLLSLSVFHFILRPWFQLDSLPPIYYDIILTLTLVLLNSWLDRQQLSWSSLFISCFFLSVYHITVRPTFIRWMDTMTWESSTKTAVEDMVVSTLIIFLTEQYQGKHSFQSIQSTILFFLPIIGYGLYQDGWKRLFHSS